MPDGMDTSRGMQMAQRGGRGGFPGGGRGGFPGGGRGGFPRGGFPRRGFPGRIPVRQPFPRFFFFPVGFPVDRCYFVDQFGRCCDRVGRCCDRFGRCGYGGGYGDGFTPYASPASSTGGWYGMPGQWDMMPDYDDMMDYDMDDMDDMDDDY